MRGRVEPTPREASKAPGRYRPVAGLATAEPVSAIHQLVALACLLVTAWILASSVVLNFPSTVAGEEARLRTMGLGMVLAIPGFARAYDPSTTRRSAAVLPFGGLLLISLPPLAGYRPDGPLAVVWWNLTVSGAALTLLGSAGLALLRWDRTNRHRLSRRLRTPPAG